MKTLFTALILVAIHSTISNPISAFADLITTPLTMTSEEAEAITIWAQENLETMPEIKVLEVKKIKSNRYTIELNDHHLVYASVKTASEPNIEFDNKAYLLKLDRCLEIPSRKVIDCRDLLVISN